MKKQLLMAAVFFSGIASIASATVVVNFGGDYVSGNTNFTRGWSGSTTGQPASVAYNNSSALGNFSGTSGTFYGAAYTSQFAASGNANIVNQSPVDTLQLDNGGASGSATQYAALFYWQKADFLNGGDASTLNIDPSTQMSFSFAEPQAGTVTAHFVYRAAGGSFYVSKNSVEDTGSTYATLNTGTDDITSYEWVAYDPSTSIFVNVATESAVISPDFTDVDAFGVYVYNANYGGRIQARLNDFEVTAVPEPSTYALLAGVFALAGTVVRRRMRR